MAVIQQKHIFATKKSGYSSLFDQLNSLWLKTRLIGGLYFKVFDNLVNFLRSANCTNRKSQGILKHFEISSRSTQKSETTWEKFEVLKRVNTILLINAVASRWISTHWSQYDVNIHFITLWISSLKRSSARWFAMISHFLLEINQSN